MANGSESKRRSRGREGRGKVLDRTGLTAASSRLRRSPSPLLPLSLLWICVLLGRPVTAGESPLGAVYHGRDASQWAGDLGSADFATRWYAAYALGQMGSKAGDAVPALERVLANLDEDEYVRGGAAWALGRLGPKAGAAVPRLTQTLASKHVSVRRNAAQALGWLLAEQPTISGPKAREGQGGAPRHQPDEASRRAITGLLKLLNDEETAVRVSAAVALWRIQRHPRAIPAVEALLRDANGSTAYRAAEALGELGPEAEPAVPSLVAALAHRDEDTRRAAAQSLGRIGAAAIPALRTVLDGNQERLKLPAVEALGWIGPAAIDALVAALKDSSPPVRRSAARALGRLGPAAIRAEPALVKAVSDPTPEVRDAAAAALKSVRPTGS